MKSLLISKEGYVVKFEVEVEPAEFEKAVESAYNKTKSRYNVPGFRKGKAPRKIIELNYGKNVFFEDALDNVVREVYPKAVEELDLTPVSSPSLDIKDMKEDNALTIEFTVDVLPEYEIPQYKGVEIEKVTKEVSDEDVQAKIDELRSRQSRYINIEGPSENGNIVNIDFDGYLDGESFEGGSAQSHELTIGEGRFIPGFEDQLVGKNVGEEFDINVTFPEDYPAEDLAGKPVVFKVKMNELKKVELPELNDEFVKDTTEFEDVESLKNDIKANLEIENEKMARKEMIDSVVEKLTSEMEVEIPESMIESKTDQMLDEINRNLSYQGWSIEKFAELSGESIESFRTTIREDAIKEIKKELLLSKIIETEKIVSTDEEVEVDMGVFAKAYGLDIEVIKANMGPEELNSIKYRLSVDKALDMLVDSAKLV